MVNKTRLFTSAIGILAVVATLGCGHVKDTSDTSGVTVSDFRVENYFRLGENQQTYTKVPQRVIALGSTQIEVLLDLGVADSILYAAEYEDSKAFAIKQVNQEAYLKLKQLPRNQVNIEHIMSFHPDLLISEESWYEKNKLGSTDYWNEHGVHTMVTPSTTSPFKLNEPETLQGEMDAVLKMGKVFHKEARAQKIVNDTMQRVASIKQAREGKEKPKVLILDLLSTKVSYGSNKIAGNMVEAIGGSVPYTTATISDEYILKEDPDIIFVVYYDDEDVIEYGDLKTDVGVVNEFKNNPQFKHTKFVKNNTIYPIPLKYVYGPMTRSIDSIGYMANLMYPGEFHFPKEYEF